MTPVQLIIEICRLNALLWSSLQKWEVTGNELNYLPVSRLVFSKLKAGIRPGDLELVPFTFWDRENGVAQALQMAADHVKTVESFTGITTADQRMNSALGTFARHFWRFWLKVAKKNPEVCLLFSGLPKSVVQVLADEDFDCLGLEQFLLTYPQQFIVQGGVPRWFEDSRDAVQDALGDWLWAEEDRDAKGAAKARARSLRLIFGRESSCDLIDAKVSFQSTPAEVEEVFSLWNAHGVGQESCFRMLSFICGTTRVENRRRWRATSHPLRKAGSFRFPSEVEGNKVSYVFEKVMGRGITGGLSAVELMRGLPVAAVYAFQLAGFYVDEAEVGRMTGVLEKKYRDCFEDIRRRSLSSESPVGSPQRVVIEERLCAIGCG